MIHDTFSHFYYYVPENAEHYEQMVGKEVLGRLLCSYLSEENRTLLSRMYQVIAVNFRDDNFALPRSSSMEERVGYEVEYFLAFFTYLMYEVFQIEVDEKGEFVAERNKISVTYELLYILKERGKPMRSEEICKKFQSRCPSYHPLSVSSVRTYLKSIDGVNSLGRIGLYGLEEWENIYWGTMIDKIYEILSIAGGPLPLSTIYQKTQEFFPNATKSSVDSSMRLDVRHRFVYDKERHMYALVEHKPVG